MTFTDLQETLVKKLLLAVSAVAGLAFLTPAQAEDICSLHYCIAAVCGSEDSCLGVQRCYYWTDYPTCIYP